VNGERHRISLELPVEKEAEARIKCLDIERGLLLTTGKGAEHQTTFTECANAYLDRPEGVGVTQSRMVELQKEYWKDTPVVDIKPVDVAAYVKKRHNGNKPGSIKRDLGAMSSVFNHAKEMELIEVVPKVRKPTVDDQRVRYLEQFEIDLVLSEAADDLRPVLTALIYTGGRLNEVLGLDYRRVLEKDGEWFLEFGTRKGKGSMLRRRQVPAHEKVMKFVDVTARSGVVFPNARGERWSDKNLQARFATLMDRCGIEDFVPNDCRHTFASHLVINDVGIRKVADLLGHKTLTMVMRYTHLAPRNLTSAVNTLKFLRFDDLIPVTPKSYGHTEKLW